MRKEANRLAEVQSDFIQHWGELLSRYGFSRTAGQVFGCLYLADSDKPLTASDLVDMLNVSRSTLSQALTELINAHLVTSARALGGRREEYKTFTNSWDFYRALVAYIQRRDIVPATVVFRRALDKSHQLGEIRGISKRLKSMVVASQICERLFDSVVAVPGERLENLLSDCTESIHNIIKTGTD